MKIFKKNNKYKGFTIVELIVVMTIIAILTLIAVPALTKYINDAENTSDLATANILYKSAVSAILNESVTNESTLNSGKIDDNVPLSESIRTGIQENASISHDDITVYTYVPSEFPTSVGPDNNVKEWQVYVPINGTTSPIEVSPEDDIYIYSPNSDTEYLNGSPNIVISE